MRGKTVSRLTVFPRTYRQPLGGAHIMRVHVWLFTLFLFIACKGEGCDPGAQLYRTEDRAPSLEDEGIKALDHLGPTLIDEGVNFGVYSAEYTPKFTPSSIKVGPRWSKALIPSSSKLGARSSVRYSCAPGSQPSPLQAMKRKSVNSQTCTLMMCAPPRGCR